MIKLNFKITAEFSCSSTKKPNNNHATLSAISKIAFIDRSFHRELPRSRNQCLSNWSIFHSRPVESQYCYICRHQRMRVKTEPASFYQRVLLSLQRKRPVTVNCPELLLSFPQWHWSSISDTEIILSSGESTLIRRTHTLNTNTFDSFSHSLSSLLRMLLQVLRAVGFRFLSHLANANANKVYFI